MRSSTILIAVSAGLAAAQTTTTSAASSTYTSDVCAQDIVDACVKSIQAQVDACKDNDWVCLCENYQSLLTCYNNCPSSDDRSPVQNEVTQYCAAAAP
ncbi:hypothetical protein K491DRAFT_695557 [Lophiostoma macrostomum CBS 122681]|uniref:Extracellular membrane protein CFEM domain-containing protein n=1 Tax=Lophiostoma macrostomum CBS 122681 TaxID=1314788 RepID=A0A6A6SXS5_9PLEO|nr:hypothetical protein K491DRAFT_695557 [Lophiostoma macrostomum CBS 122681]